MTVESKVNKSGDEGRRQSWVPGLDQDYVAAEIDTQELVGVGKSPVEAIRSAAPRYLSQELETFPATRELADLVRTGKTTCWLLNEGGIACSDEHET